MMATLVMAIFIVLNSIPIIANEQITSNSINRLSVDEAMVDSEIQIQLRDYFQNLHPDFDFTGFVFVQTYIE